jgi:multiple sugar transport system permease protein
MASVEKSPLADGVVVDSHRHLKPQKGGLPLQFWLMLPAIALLAGLTLYPFFYMVYMSLNKVSLIGGVSFDWVGLRNWQSMFADPGIRAGWWITIVYFVSTVGFELVLGVTIALLIYEQVWARNMILSLLLMPMFIAPVIVGLLGEFLCDPVHGLYAWGLRGLKLFTGNILGNADSALIAVILMDVWEWTPLVALITLAGLTALPKDLLEAASIDGATYWQKLWHIMAPLSTGVVTVALLIRSMDAIRDFAIILITTNGGPADATKTIPIRLYETAFRFFNLGYAAAIGLSMVVVTILLATAFLETLRKRNLIQ